MLGHEGIPANERVDEEAKWVAKGESSEMRLLPRGCKEDMLQVGQLLSRLTGRNSRVR